MPNIENLRKQAKQLVRWHREGYYPIAQRIRVSLPRCRELSDADVLAGSFALHEAQEVIACEAGFDTWAALKSGAKDMATPTVNDASIELVGAHPQVFVTSVEASCAFFVEQLGFSIDYTYGEPAFYAQVQRDTARLNLRHVDDLGFWGDLRERDSLLSANVPVDNVKALFLEYQSLGVDFQQSLKKQPWGEDFVVRDPDGNLIGFGEANPGSDS